MDVFYESKAGSKKVRYVVLAFRAQPGRFIFLKAIQKASR